jgi:hypothetical protein
VRLVAVMARPAWPEARLGELHLDKRCPICAEIHANVNTSAVWLSPGGLGQWIFLGRVLKQDLLDRREHLSPGRPCPLSLELKWPEKVERKRLRTLEVVNPNVQVLPVGQELVATKRWPEVPLPLLSRGKDVACVVDWQTLACCEFPKGGSDAPLSRCRRLRQWDAFRVAEPGVTDLGKEPLVRFLGAPSVGRLDGMAVA